MTALGTVLLFLTEIIPAGRLGLMAVASFPVCASLLMYGAGWAAGVFAVTAVLAGLLFPGAAAIGYAAFFGLYPILKSLVERLERAGLRVLLKLVIYCAAFAVWRLAAAALFPAGSEKLAWYVLLLLGAVVFFVYDWCYSVIISFYLDKIARFIK